MEKDKKGTIQPTENKPQTGIPVKGDEPAAKTPATDAGKNVAKQEPGLNQERTTRQDILPPD